MRQAFKIGTETIAAGKRCTVDLPVSVLSNHTPISLPVHVVHGLRDGPTMFVSAAVHGDEIIGVEIIRRVLRSRWIKRVKGTLLCLPIVNAYGFISHNRYLPDRRDLNRSFPGSSSGSLASQLAHLFTNEVLRRCDYGVDLHSAALHRTNLPQIRISKTNATSLSVARAFGAPIIMVSPVRAGSLRETAANHGVEVMVYEGGEALRFDETVIRAGMRGVARVMRHLGMVADVRLQSDAASCVLSRSSYWVRAPHGGILRAHRTVGESVGAESALGVISDPFGENETELKTGDAGLIIGRTNLPVVNQGDALFHVARIAASDAALASVGRLEEQLVGDPLFDEDEIL